MKQADWNALQRALLSPGETHDGTVVEPFFRRLLAVIRDSKAGYADRALACRDVFGCAQAHCVAHLALQLPTGSVSAEHLARAGLIQDPLTRQVRLDQTLEEPELAVYRRQRRRYLQQIPMDVALSGVLENAGFSRYNGRGQQAAVRTLLTSPADSTVIVNLPTGCGKTLAIQAMSLFAYRQKLVLVVVPTVGLAIEQAQRAGEVLKAAGSDHGGSYFWTGGQADEERKQIRERMLAGTQRLLFCAPESVITALRPVLFQLAQHGLLGAMVIDEAHLVDHWGAEFRPEFQLLAPLFHSLREHSSSTIRTLLMSATFSASTLELLKDSFVPDGSQAIEVNGSFLRPETNFNVRKTSGEQEHRNAVLEMLWRLPRPLILYTTTREDAENWWQTLIAQGFSRVGLFHGETDISSRKLLIDQWQGNALDIMVATSAFGVGMDKSDVRSVLHAAVPENMDRFYQEAGRGGRDGNACWSWLIFHPAQVVVAERLSKAKLISTGLGLARWKMLLQSRQRKGDSYFTISLTALHRDLQRHSEGNEDWNMRTLLLMQRAGLIRLCYAPPEAPLFEGAPIEEHTTLRSQYFEQYFNRIGVQILNDAHMSEDVWQQYVEPQRCREKQARAIGFASLRNWLNDPQRPLCRQLEEFYRPGSIAPERSCGGCPGCRAQGRGAFTPTLSTVFHLNGLPPISLPRWMPPSQVLRLRYRPETYRSVEPRVLLHNWRRWLAELLRSGQVQAIRASRPLLNELKQAAELKALPFWCALEPGDSAGHWIELVLLMPGENHLPSVGMDDPAQLIVAPETVADPLHPYRSWWECDPQSRILDEFVKDL